MATLTDRASIVNFLKNSYGPRWNMLKPRERQRKIENMIKMSDKVRELVAYQPKKVGWYVVDIDEQIVRRIR